VRLRNKAGLLYARQFGALCPAPVPPQLMRSLCAILCGASNSPQNRYRRPLLPIFAASDRPDSSRTPACSLSAACALLIMRTAIACDASIVLSPEVRSMQHHVEQEVQRPAGPIGNVLRKHCRPVVTACVADSRELNGALRSMIVLWSDGEARFGPCDNLRVQGETKEQQRI
jgi:hypothetical protein